MEKACDGTITLIHCYIHIKKRINESKPFRRLENKVTAMAEFVVLANITVVELFVVSFADCVEK